MEQESPSYLLRASVLQHLMRIHRFGW